MAEEQESTGLTKARLDWAKAGARTYSALVAGHNRLVSKGLNADKMRIGLVSFSTRAEPAQAFRYLDSASPDADPAGMVESPLVPVIELRSGEALPDGFLDQADYLAEVADLQAQGLTALYAGLHQARQTLLAQDASRNRAIVVLSDGFPNICGLEGDFCGSELALRDAEALADLMRGDTAHPIQVFAVPLAGAENMDYLAELFEGVQGGVFEVEDARDLPITMAEIYARLSGAAPVLARSRFSVSRPVIVPYSYSPGDIVPDEVGPYSLSEDFTFPVEVDAHYLNLVLATRADLPETWSIGFELIGPEGTYRHDDPGLVRRDVGGYFDIVQIPAPAAGPWTVRLYSTNDSDQHGHVLAWTDNPAPDCWAGVDTRNLRTPGDSVRIWAHATWNGPLDGVDYRAEILLPDGTLIREPLLPSPDGSGAELLFDRLDHRGIYRATVTCEAGTGTAWNLGERIPGIDDLDEDGESEPSPPVPHFRRTASADFLVDVGLPPDLADPNDADRDEIPNPDEGVTCPPVGSCTPPSDAIDSDGDGWFDAQDRDSDNDELSDWLEGTLDSDGDGILDFRDWDSDNDGTVDGLDPSPTDPSVGGREGTCHEARDLLFEAARKLWARALHDADGLVLRAFEIERGILGQLPPWEPRAWLLYDALYAEYQALASIRQAGVAPTPWDSHVHAREASMFLWHAWLLKGVACGVIH